MMHSNASVTSNSISEKALRGTFIKVFSSKCSQIQRKESQEISTGGGLSRLAACDNCHFSLALGRASVKNISFRHV